MSIKKSKGNMYPWVSHTHSHLGGECSHKCSYCYVDNPKFGRPEKYKGAIRLIDHEFAANYGKGNTIFIENCNDLFAADVPASFIERILAHCRTFPDNVYVFQTKNPGRYFEFPASAYPVNAWYGTTIETNRPVSDISTAPNPRERFLGITDLKGSGRKTFITIEPILDFDVEEFSERIIAAMPDFINIGADSKGHGLKEPSADKILAFIKEIEKSGIEIRQKHNLGRLVPSL